MPFRPGIALLWAVSAYAILSLLLIPAPALTPAWLGLGVVLLIGCVVDYLISRRPAGLSLERQLADPLPVGIWSDVSLKLRNQSNRNYRLRVFDHQDEHGRTRLLPQKLSLAANSWQQVNYRLRPEQRGDLQFGRCQALLRSRFGFWDINLWLGQAESRRVYPNYSAVSKFALLASEDRSSQMGIRKRRRRGTGHEFHQLRDYREGDSLRQIDWKATSRLRRPISREYQDERDQQIVFLLDCGRRMRAQDGELSHFDHCLNALLLLSHVAIKQGDSVSVHTFGGVQRSIPSCKGAAAMKSLLGNLYDLQPTTEAADFLSAAEDILAKQRKRSLVVILTNTRDEDYDDLSASLRLLGKRHLVLLASLREQVLDDTLETAVQDFEGALKVAGTWQYLSDTKTVHQRLRDEGGLLLSTTTADLPVAIVNRYLEAKRSGRL